MNATAKSDRLRTKPQWQFCLYVADQSPRSLQAFANLKKIFEKELFGRYKVKVIDVLANPLAARAGNIVALPTLVRTFPPPMRTVIGDLSNIQRTIKGLDLRLSA
jgi:circadian clock protein KaiB